MEAEAFVARLASARIGETFNFYRYGRGAAVRRARLRAYLDARAGAELLLVGEAAGYRGARVSGIPFTSERQLTGSGPAEATATIVQRALTELELDALCWNVVPTHPGTPARTGGRHEPRSPPAGRSWTKSRPGGRFWRSGRWRPRRRERPPSVIRAMAERPNSGPGCYDSPPADASERRLFSE